jgi:hypothetical protein
MRTPLLNKNLEHPKFTDRIFAPIVNLAMTISVRHDRPADGIEHVRIEPQTPRN